ncbi:hypothetical protein C6502_06960 [Candidatus Poribacteria bacterium]|nr:MAG: hypothetical protein C6502_06960 [Candidatus Poribacteria bacterium]
MSDEPGKILIIEDEEIYADVYSARLVPLGYQIETATDTSTASQKLESFRPDIIILDLRLQRQDSEEGLAFLTEIAGYNPAIKVIIVTVEGTIENAMRAHKLGAYDFIEKKTQGYNELPFRVNQAYEKLQLERRIADLQQSEIDRIKGYRYGTDKIIIGDSESMHRLFEDVDRVASTDATVLVQGESGTGKELIAQAIHHHSSRAKQPFVTVACGQTDNALLGSELFGYERGAFTGATGRKGGKFESANHGTIFLDEIAELDAESQVKFLRVLQERKFERLGGKQTIEVDVRVIAATNKNLEQAVQESTFREDLYYRLNVFPLHVPPLRERKSDIPLLATHFLSQKLHLTDGKQIRGFQEAAMTFLTSYAWPGNVRELENRIEQAVVLVTGDWVSAADLRIDAAGKFETENKGLTELVNEYERILIVDALEGAVDQKAAADHLGIPESTLRRKMDKYSIERSQSRKIRQKLQ